ncbi:hypothetical protein FEE95_16020 [Maribacter algarum]|uniref:Uncharacterized protein n=1 Tax=Maribacter algarum (ex Zhang et al. 2020) TaxID=2578118 RepID=A0A5S3PNY2_9FLAO|nr:hypothetical protein [Maribacter algarum]TMM56133.1 hypothetical protein FEE95_16020 [Maribacter algarum]
MRNTSLFLLITFFAAASLSAQVKIGDNPQNIDPSSVLELESTDKVLVITRVTTAQMNAIVPSEGALCFNTDLQSVHYYNGTQWVNIGGGVGTGGPLTADPIVNTQPTIVITPTATGDNLEVAPNSIRSEQIVDGGINGVDIQDGSLGPGKLQDFSITQEKLSENSVGAFALDNDNFGVSAFNNDAGYITAGDVNVVSGDPGNAISSDANGAAFYDDTNLLMDIMDNADAIAMDDDQSSANEIQNLTLTGTEIGLTSTAGTIDIGPLISAGGSDDQNIGPVTLDAMNVLSIGIEGGNPATVDLSSLAGGAGSTEVVDGQTLIGAGTAVDPFEIAPSGTNGWFLQTDTAGDVVWAELPPATSGGVLTDGLTIVGTGAAIASQLSVPAGGISTTEIANATILGEDLAQMAATDGQVLAWDGAGGIWAPSSAGGTGGSTELVDGITLTGDGTLGNEFKIEPSATNGQFLSTDATGDVVWANLPPSGGSALFDANTISGTGVAGDEYTVADDGIITTKILDGNVTPIKIEPSATVNQVLTTTATGTAWADLPPSGGTALFDPNTISGTGVTGDEYTVADDAITTTKIENATILAEDLNDMGATADGDIIKWNTTLNAGAGGWEVGVNAGHTGAAKSIFLADASGNPTQAFHPTNSSPSLVWDYEARVVFGTAYGALGVGLDGATFNNEVKMQVVDNVFGGLSYPMQVQNNTNGSSSTAILFSTGGGLAHGKGALAFQNTGGQGIGDFHFLNDANADTSNAELNDKAFTVKSNKDIVLYGGIEVEGTGPGTGLGTANQVLSSTGAGVQWVTPTGAVSDTDINDGLSDYGTTVGYNVNVDDSTIELMSDQLRIKPATLPAVDPTTQVLTTDKDSGAIEWKDFNETTVPVGTADNQVIKWNNTSMTWELGTDNSGAPTLTDGNIYVGNVSNQAISVPMSGDALIDNTGELTIQANAIENNMLDKAAIPLSGFANATADINMGGFKITNVIDPTADQEVATKKYVDDNAGSNLSNANLSQTATDLVRTYEIPNNTQSLVFSGLGRVGIGNGANPPQNKLHVAGAIRSEGILNSDGDNNNPSYRFSGDTDTGMFWRAADEIGFSVGTIEAASIQQLGASSKVVINQSLELDGQLLDESNVAGSPGQVLTATSTGTDWANSTGAAQQGKILAVTGTAGAYTITVTGQTSTNYIINTSVVENTAGNPILLQITSQTATDFSVQIYEFIAGVPTPSNATWFYTIFNP